MELIETYGISDFEIDTRSTVPDSAASAEIPIFQDAEVAKATIAISRAKIGNRELRLMSITSGGKLKSFQIHKVTIHPYKIEQQDVKPARKRKKAPTENDALAAFLAATEAEFPMINLKNGQAVSTYQKIL
jgi:hypothetical protein